MQLNTPDNPLSPGKKSILVTFAMFWLLSACILAGYATLKPSTSAGDIPGLPASWVQWLDQNYDLRTLLMTLLVCQPPALLLAAAARPRLRRRLLLACGVLLVVYELLQLGIPSRGFGVADLGYTILGVSVAELVASCFDLFSSGIHGPASSELPPNPGEAASERQSVAP